MFKIQVNIGNDVKQNQVNVDNGLIVFSDGFLNVSYRDELSQFGDAFLNIKGNYANVAYLVKGDTGDVLKINYFPNILYAPEENDTALFKKYSFRIVFIDNYVDQIKIPRFYFFIPKVFICYTPIDTNYNNFFLTDKSDIYVGDQLLLDGKYYVEVTKKRQEEGYYKYFFKSGYSHIKITKERFVIINLSNHFNDSIIKNKILFHNENLTVSDIPDVNINSDETDINKRNFKNINTQFDVDYSNLPFTIKITNDDILNDMLLDDFKLKYNIEEYSTSITCDTSNFNRFKKGDYLLIKNQIYGEIFHIKEVNYDGKILYLNDRVNKYFFAVSDPTLEAFICKKIYFQPLVLLDYNKKQINYPLKSKFIIEYLNI